MRDGVYHTGDVASRDADGYITYVGRTDDVFKASDYRISPFELESVLLEHEAVAEAAVVPSPDALRLAVPKAFVMLAAGHQPDAETARSILAFARRAAGAVQAGAAAGVRRAAEDHLRQDPPGGAARRSRTSAQFRRNARAPGGPGRVLGRGLPGPSWTGTGGKRARRHRHRRRRCGTRLAGVVSLVPSLTEAVASVDAGRAGRRDRLLHAPADLDVRARRRQQVPVGRRGPRPAPGPGARQRRGEPARGRRGAARGRRTGLGHLPAHARRRVPSLRRMFGALALAEPGWLAAAERAWAGPR